MSRAVRFVIAFLLVASVALTASAENVVARVNIASQTMTVSVDGTLLHTWSVSTARKGYTTPLGSYTPYWLSKNHRSKAYNNAPMPYAVFFLRGYAFHGTTDVKALGRRASHGCVRLLVANARVLYELVELYGKKNVSIIIE